MSEQESNGKPENAPGDKTAQEQAAELLRRMGEAKSHKVASWIQFVIAYLTLVLSVAGVGGLAFYAGHKTATEWLLSVSIGLLILIPITILIYGGISLHKKLPPLMDTAFGRFLSRNFRAVNLSFIAADCINILCLITFRFDRHPKEVLIFAVLVGAHAIFAFGLVLQYTARQDVSELRLTLFQGFDLLSQMDEGLVKTIREIAKDKRGSGPK